MADPAGVALSMIADSSKGPFGPDLKSMLTLQQLSQQNEVARQEQQGINTLRSLFADQSNIDPKTNTLTPQALSQVWQASPAMGLKYSQFQAQNATRQAQLAGQNALLMDRRNKEFDRIIIQANNRRQDLVQGGMSPQTADEVVGREVWGPGMDYMRSSGLCDRDQCAQLPSRYNYEAASGALAWRQAQQAQQKADIAANRDARQDIREERLATTAQQQAANEQQRLTIAQQNANRLAEKPGIEHTYEVEKPDGTKTNELLVRKPDGTYLSAQGNVPVEGKVTRQLTGTQAGADPARAEAMADLIGTYAQAPPGAYALRSPEVAEAMKIVKEKYPGWDAKKYNEANTIRQDFARRTGTGKNIDAINTVVQHLDVLDDVTKGLNNTNSPAANTVMNFVRTQLGHPEVTNFNVAAQIVADEAVNAVVGAGAVFDREKMAEQIKGSRSPAQFEGIRNQIARLMAGRMDSLQQRWTAAGLPKEEFEAKLLPETHSAMDQFRRGTPKEGGGQTGGAKGPASSSDMPPVPLRAGHEQEDYDKLPPGAVYYTPDGTHRRKP